MNNPDAVLARRAGISSVTEYLLFTFAFVMFFRFFQFILYSLMNIPLVFYDTDNPFKLYVLEICIALACLSNLALFSYLP